MGPGASHRRLDQVTKCQNLNNFGTLGADSKHIGNSTSDMLLITHNVIYIHPNFKHIQALLHICNIISELSKTRFGAHRVNLLTARPIKPYMVPSCRDLETVLVNFAKTMLCFSKPWGPIIP